MQKEALERPESQKLYAIRFQLYQKPTCLSIRTPDAEFYPGTDDPDGGILFLGTGLADPSGRDGPGGTALPAGRRPGIGFRMDATAQKSLSK